MKNFDDVKNVKRKIEDNMLSMKGVHGISIGEDKDNPDDFCIYLHVEPGASTDAIPSEIEDIKIIVSFEEQAVPHVDTGLYRPLVGGCQINAGLGNGTLGCIVKDNKDGKTCVLSNQHAIGYPGTITGQPTLSNQIGKTIRSSGTSNLVDGAVAEIDKNISSEASILDIGSVTGTYDVTSEDIKGKGYPISKRGRTTGLTHSFITRLDYSGQRDDGWAFKNQLYVSPAFTQGGDSGSAYVNKDKKIVGLHWGGTDSMGAGSPIADVLTCLNISVMTLKDVIASEIVEEAATVAH